jgi:TRAP-type C4-dicarboxylate transport system permease small subunit
VPERSEAPTDGWQPTSIPKWASGWRGTLARRAFRFVLRSPLNAALYGFIISVAGILMALAMWSILLSTGRFTLDVPLWLPLGAIVLGGPLGGLLSYYIAPPELRKRFRE